MNSTLDDKVAVVVTIDRFCFSETLGVGTIGVNLTDEDNGLKPRDPLVVEVPSNSEMVAVIKGVNNVLDCC